MMIHHNEKSKNTGRISFLSLTHKVPPIICDNFKFCLFFKNNKGMIFHKNCLLADNSHEISYLIFFRKLRKMVQNLSSADVVIGNLRVKKNRMKLSIMGIKNDIS